MQPRGEFFDARRQFVFGNRNPFKDAQRRVFMANACKYEVQRG